MKDHDKDLYILFEGRYIIPTSMDDDTYLRYIYSLNIKRCNDDILIIDKTRKHKRGYRKPKTQKEEDTD